MPVESKHSTVDTMKVARQGGYGTARDVVSLVEAPVPRPGPGQVLIEVKASTINALDHHFLTGSPYFLRLQNGLRTPKRTVPGADVAGTVVDTAPDVVGFEPGDRVFGDIGSGGFAQYAVGPAEQLAHSPTNLPLEECATLGVAALTALQGLRDWGMIETGDRVLINGASGGVGSFAIQIARALGASHITAVCSTPNVETARSLGADRVIDYTTGDFADTEERFDIFFDNAGSRSLRQSARLLSDRGRLTMITGKKGKWIRPVDRVVGGVVSSWFWGSRRFISRVAAASGQDGARLARMVEDGEVRPVIDRRFTLDEAVDALEYQARGHARGKSLVVVS